MRPWKGGGVVETLVAHIPLNVLKSILISEKKLATITKIHQNSECLYHHIPKNTIFFHKSIPYHFNYLENTPISLKTLPEPHIYFASMLI